MTAALIPVTHFLQSWLGKISWTPNRQSNCTYTYQSSGWGFHTFPRHRMSTLNDLQTIAFIGESTKGRSFCGYAQDRP